MLLREVEGVEDWAFVWSGKDGFGDNGSWVKISWKFWSVSGPSVSGLELSIFTRFSGCLLCSVRIVSVPFL